VVERPSIWASRRIGRGAARRPSPVLVNGATGAAA
jgi:hypothetical protein